MESAEGKYSFKKCDDNSTELEYYEWVKSGYLENPFTTKTLRTLKSVMEQSN